VDISFDDEGTTFVMPTPPMGEASDYFINGRPRQNSTGIASAPVLATVFAGLTHEEWNKFHKHRPSTVGSPTYGAWRAKENRVRVECRKKPFIAMPITLSGWRDWKREQPSGSKISIHHYATALFEEKARRIALEAREYHPDAALPHRFMLLTTEEIGQDQAFDVSHLTDVYVHHDGTASSEQVWTNKAIFFEYGLIAAAVEAIVRGVEFVRWQKDKSYAWS
jgi:hypothetical protein